MADSIHIESIDSAINAWGTEVTQKQISNTLNQLKQDSSVLRALVEKIATGTKVTEADLKDIANAIKSHKQQQESNSDVDHTDNEKINRTTGKGFSDLQATWAVFTGKWSDAEREKANADKARARNEQQLRDMGMSKEMASNMAQHKESIDHGKRRLKRLGEMAIAAKLLFDVTKESLTKGYSERHSLVTEMRQRGLLAGMAEAEAGFISMSQTISDTNFTFGEAAEFTKIFAKTVGVTGVKEALKFANSMAASGESTGLMQRYAMDFGQVANLSGQYLESVRVSGQLKDMSDMKLRSGMDDFMSNVEMTSNVLKVSMTDAAEMMQKSLGGGQAGLLATLPGEMGDTVRATLQSLNVQGGPMADALSARLAAGSQAAFLQTAEFQALNQNAMGRELLDFVNQAASQFENNGAEDFQGFMASNFPEFAKSFVDFASQGGIRVQMLQSPEMAGMLGQLIELAQTYGDADKSMPKTAVEDITQMLADEQKRQAAVLAEAGFNTAMAGFTTNLQELTRVNAEFAVEAASLLEEMGAMLNGMANVSTSIEKVVTGTMGWFTGLGADVLGFFSKDNERVVDLVDNKMPAINEFKNKTSTINLKVSALADDFEAALRITNEKKQKQELERIAPLLLEANRDLATQLNAGRENEDLSAFLPKLIAAIKGTSALHGQVEALIRKMDNE